LQSFKSLARWQSRSYQAAVMKERLRRRFPMLITTPDAKAAKSEVTLQLGKFRGN
jgi:hypothetical protein